MTLADEWVRKQVDRLNPPGVDWDACMCGHPRWRHDIHTPHCGIRFRCEGFTLADRKA